MANPTYKDLQLVDEALSGLAVRYTNTLPLVWRDVFTVVPVSKTSVTYPVYDKSDLLRIEAQESEFGSDPVFMDYRVTRQAATIREYKLAKSHSYKDVKNQADSFDIEADAVVILTDQVTRRVEKAAADATMVTGKWGVDLSTPPGGTWESGGTPRKDVIDLMNTFAKDNGVMPNIIILGAKVFDKLRTNTDIVGALATNRDQVVTETLLKELWFSDNPGRVLVPRAVYDTSNEKITSSATGAYIWKEDAFFMGYISEIPTTERPTAQVALLLEDILVRRWELEARRSFAIEASMGVAFKTTATDLGVYIDQAVI
ncbi:hypothetical protein D6779_11110 [Candidatus Parcubacteria bacterium]|nr:MAG: hypothetical protein D6779_11110 [Candidatus Parcubacteria bacterium]